MPEVVAILCSGQGGRHPAMFDLVVNRPEAKPVFAARSAAFGFSSSVASAINRCTSGSYATSLVKAVLERQLLAQSGPRISCMRTRIVPRGPGPSRHFLE